MSQRIASTRYFFGFKNQEVESLNLNGIWICRLETVLVLCIKSCYVNMIKVCIYDNKHYVTIYKQ